MFVCFDSRFYVVFLFLLLFFVVFLLLFCLFVVVFLGFLGGVSFLLN